MKLATFSFESRRSVGVIRGEHIVDIAGEGGLPSSMEALLALGPSALDEAARLAKRGPPVPITSVHLHAPVTAPRKFLAIAANYQSHIDEVLASNPDYVPPIYQRWFSKLTTSINGPCDPILMPPASSELDYEAELAIVIGRRCRRVPAERAAEVIAGYTICNDVSVRDWQRRSPTIMLGKSYDSHGPLGPWLVTPDEIGNPHALTITCTVNGETRQSGSTSEMINDCFEQIAYLSTVCTLEPGDVIATGTPKGTGGSMRPPRFLAIGDVVRCAIDRIGAIEASIVEEQIG
jgi:2-keto-4-pentenoate hydratase/2-oxohepta-3-ene-1,7-dioic acid hydratase in catechol pathway